MTKLLLLDLDGTVRRCKSNPQGFINDPKDQELIEGVEEAIARYASEGWSIVGITNQGGVAAGHKSLEDAIAEQAYTLLLLPQIEIILFCPDFEGRQCWKVGGGSSGEVGYAFPFVGTYRKPNPGMLELAQALYHNPQEILYVGDRSEDEQAGAAAGVRFMWAEEWWTGKQ